MSLVEGNSPTIEINLWLTSSMEMQVLNFLILLLSLLPYNIIRYISTSLSL